MMKKIHKYMFFFIQKPKINNSTLYTFTCLLKQKKNRKNKFRKTAKGGKKNESISTDLKKKKLIMLLENNTKTEEEKKNVKWVQTHVYSKIYNWIYA